MILNNWKYVKLSLHLKFCKLKVTLEKLQWKLHRVEYTKQIDDFNCGIFLLIFMEKLSKTKAYSKLKFIYFENDVKSLNKYRLTVDSLFKQHAGKIYNLHL